jgi:hypothetical protein
MAKGSKGGFNAKDTGNIPSGPSASDLGVPKAPERTTMNDDAVRTSVARNPKGG